jgi:hypothetical protein
MKMCINCGIKGTSAPHGYCTSISNGCRGKNQYKSRVIKRDRDDLEAYVQTLIAELAAECPETQPIAAGATSG